MADKANDSSDGRWHGALAGLLALAAALGVAELVAALVRPEASPVVAIGGEIIDLSPTWLKEFGIQTFGTADKPILVGSIVVVQIGRAHV